MGKTPRIEINLSKIKYNAQQLVFLAAKRGVSVTAVTKLVGGEPKILEVLLAAGCSFLGDSRLRHIKKIYEFERKRTGGYGDRPLIKTGQMGGQIGACPLIRISLTPLSEIEETVVFVDYSFHSSIETIEIMATAAKKYRRRHGIILVLEYGDLREGANIEELPELILAVKKHVELFIQGLAINPACFSGLCPDDKHISDFSVLVSELEHSYNCAFPLVSGGNSSSIDWLLRTDDVGRINNVRLGESIFLGQETLHRQKINDLFTDAFTYVAELVEIKKKPSIPYGGKLGFNAFGENLFSAEATKQTKRRSALIWRYILNTGRQDIVLSGLKPESKRLQLIGASSDCLVLERQDGDDNLWKIGDEIRLRPNYECLLSIMNSDCVSKLFI